MAAGLLHGAAHITGGGITDNTPRMLPKGFGGRRSTRRRGRFPPLFEVLRRIGNIPEDDYRRTLNLGVGMILAVPARAAAKAEAVLSKLGEDAIPHREGGGREARPSARGVPVKRLGILISGRGSNFEAIADSVRARWEVSARRLRW